MAALAPAPTPAVATSDGDDVPLLVILKETGEKRDGLPVFTAHPDTAGVAERLAHGLPGMMLRLYRFEQQYLHEREGSAVEPAYVLLSNRQGGFARKGFFLDDVEKREAGYVDVMHSWPVTGRFGAMDQLVPHELFHVMRRQLIGEITEGYTNQVHAIGVRTDRLTAFNEGFAEHLQAVAFEHPEADPTTRALANDVTRYEAVLDRLQRYERELTARIAFAPRLRMGFLAWYSNDEDVLRYYAVRDNAFARERPIADRLLGEDLYTAYLVESILPGVPSGAVKSISRMLATEGVVATLFYRWAMHAGLQGRYRDEAFYAQFRTTVANVTPLENVYLKLVHAMYENKPVGTDDLIAGYCRSFPEDASDVVSLATEVFLGQAPAAPKELWLANTALQTGTTVFDQFRGLPRQHTFDLNAASLVDLVSVPGVNPTLARAIQMGAPYESIDALGAVPGMSDEIVARFRELSAEMETLLATADDESVEDAISIRTIIRPFVIRAVIALIAAFALGAFLYRAVRARDPVNRPSVFRFVSNGFAAALVGFIAGWLFGAAGFASLIAVTTLFGVPSALWRWRKTGHLSAAGLVLLAWVAAALPSAVLVTPLF